MAILKCLVFAASLILIADNARTQQKYALVIGINDYYETPAAKSADDCLNGPVNDANAIRNILINKFGFKATNIDTIYNATATRDNITAGIEKKIRQCKPGDYMFFYYSGHGIWMNNTEEKKDSIKDGMNQAMVTSDLYNFKNKFKCFLRDFTLKTYFNKFVDKKVILTTIFDCCYSGNLARAGNDANANLEKGKAIDFNELMGRLTENVDDTNQFIDSIAGITKPPGCAINDNGELKDNTDTDGDGVPDCKDKEKNTSKGCFPVDQDGVGKCHINLALQKALNEFDGAELSKKLSPGDNNVAFRHATAMQAISISEKDTIPRPADRKNSRFLFMAATTDRQPGLEFRDENKIVHGMFTASIMRVMAKYPGNTAVDILFQKIKEDMDTFHKDQTPTMYADPKRLKYNLVGTPLIK